MAIRLLAGVATGMYAGALIAKSYESANGNGSRFALAGIISFGSLGWFSGTLGAGMLKQLFGGSMDVVFAFSALMFLAGFILSKRMKSASVANDGESGTPGEVTIEAAATIIPANLGTTFQLLRRNKIVYSSFFLRQLGASAVWSMFPIFLAHELGASDLWIGVIYGANAITQSRMLARQTVKVQTAQG